MESKQAQKLVDLINHKSNQIKKVISVHYPITYQLAESLMKNQEKLSAELKNVNKKIREKNKLIRQIKSKHSESKELKEELKMKKKTNQEEEYDRGILQLRRVANSLHTSQKDKQEANNLIKKDMHILKSLKDNKRQMLNLFIENMGKIKSVAPENLSRWAEAENVIISNKSKNIQKKLETFKSYFNQ